jgi:small subunit ribosomal protein S27Ae
MAEKEGGKKPHSKSKHKNIQIWKKYKDGKAQGKWCPRCGAGTMLADYGNRVTCGKCHYSEIKVKKTD